MASIEYGPAGLIPGPAFYERLLEKPPHSKLPIDSSLLAVTIMDGISTAAAVIGLVQAGTQVTIALRRYVSSAKEADSSRARLLDQIKLISAAETTIESIVRNSSPSLRTPGLQALIDEWFKENGPPRTCKRELEELASWLESEREAKKHKKWVKMIAWPTKEDKVQAAIRAFEGYMPYFRDVLAIETL